MISFSGFFQLFGQINDVESLFADRLFALVNDGVRQNDGGRGAVADVIVGFIGGLFYQIGAEIFKFVFQLYLLGDRYAVKVTCGAPKPFFRTTARPRGPKVIRTASASLSIPFFIDARASSLNKICLAMILIQNINVNWQFGNLFQNREYVALVADQILLAVQLHFVRAVLLLKSTTSPTLTDIATRSPFHSVFPDRPPLLFL